MATTNLRPRQGIRFNRSLIIGIVVIVLAIVAAVLIVRPPRGANAQAASNQSTVAVTRGSITQAVSGSGTITAAQTLDLVFQTSGVVQQVMVKEGDTAQAGQVLATLDDRDLQSKVADAQASLESARAKLLQLQKGNARPEDLAYDQAAVASAQVAYNAAVQDAQAGDSTLRSLQATLDKAQVAVQQAQAAYDRVGGASNPNIGMLQQSKDLQTATIDYQKALNDYNAQLKTSAPDAQSKVRSALTTLQQAQANLAKLTAPATDTDLAIQQAAVAQAEQALKQAQLNLEEATLKAPFEGVITNVNMVPGSSANGSAMTLMDRNPLYVHLKLSENDVVKTAVGQTVDLTDDALPDWKAQGQLTYLAPAGATSNGVVTYEVHASFEDSDPRIKVGMTLNVDILTAHKENVLIVPNSALLPKGSGHAVQVLVGNGQVQEVDVQTGINDGTHTEIVSGLGEGQKIIALPSSNTNSAPRGLFGGG